jgi:hypothetical protein
MIQAANATRAQSANLCWGKGYTKSLPSPTCIATATPILASQYRQLVFLTEKMERCAHRPLGILGKQMKFPKVWLDSKAGEVQECGNRIAAVMGKNTYYGRVSDSFVAFTILSVRRPGNEEARENAIH